MKRKKSPWQSLYKGLPLEGLVAKTEVISNLSVSDIVWTQVTVGVPNCPNIPIKKEEEMNSIEQNRIDYLQGRVYSVFREKNHELERSFGLRDDGRPRTAKEIVERIQSGKFVLPTKKSSEDCDCDDCLTAAIRWRDPSVKEDEESYKKAFKMLESARTKVEDTIMLGEPKAGLEALQEFEARSFN